MNSTTTALKKPWYKSKILWFNTLVAALAALEASAHLIQAYVPGNVFGYGLLATTLINAMLRIITSQGLSLK